MLNTTLNHFNKVMKRLNNKVKKEFVAELSKVLKDNAIQQINWQGYTPYFCDGEPCTYGIGSVYFKIAENDTIVDSYNIKDKKIKQIATKIEESLQEHESMLLSIFGDHKEISIDSNGNITETDYSDHD